MPELPDIVVYQESLQRRILGQSLTAIRLHSPFVLRTAAPPLSEALDRTVVSVPRLGKRIVIGLNDERYLVLHLMIAGRLHWCDLAGAARTKTAGAAAPRKLLARFEFDNGHLLFTEAGTRKRASLHLLSGAAALAAADPGGLEVFEASEQQFVARLQRENHTLKRALTDPHCLSGIGNAYSDEILHRARLSPIALTQKLSAVQSRALFDATRAVLTEWTALLRALAGDAFPGSVTAFRPQMAVHGRYGQPCPACGAPVQRIVYATNETNYCARCQTQGVVLKDRALSRLLKSSWPRSIDEL